MVTGKKKVIKKKVAKKTANLAVQHAMQEKIEITAKTEDFRGVYSNFAFFKHTKREFVLDFLWRIDNKNILVSRIITSPQHARAIHKALGINIENYEKQQGAIKED